MLTKIAEWRSRSGKHRVALHRYEDGSGAYSYRCLEGERGRGGGILYAPTDAEAVAHMIERIVPIAQPDANKTPMIRINITEDVND